MISDIWWLEWASAADLERILTNWLDRVVLSGMFQSLWVTDRK